MLSHRRGLTIAVAMISLLISSLLLPSAQAVTFVYDDLNRLIQVDYGDGRVIGYTYDAAGNRESRTLQGVCSYSISPAVQGYPVSGGTGTINITTGSSCQWTASSNQSWITITSGASGTGNGTVNYTVASFSGSADRMGTMGVAGQTFSVSQAYATDTTAPTGTILAQSGATYTDSESVTLYVTCSDGLECVWMQFSNDGTTYSTPEPYSTTKLWTLPTGSGSKTVYVKFADAAGNWSSPYTATIVLNSNCASPLAKIGAITYPTLQEAYDAATSGSTILVQGIKTVESLAVNRNITVTLNGGYNCDFTSNNATLTVIKGSVTTTTGGGTTTMKNVKLSDQ